MTVVDEFRFSRQKLSTSVRSILFFILFFLLIYVWVDPKLIYHGQGQYLSYQIYVPGMRTFVDIPPFPGEPVAYLSARLSHYYYYSWAGALIITVVAWLLYLCTAKFIKAVGADRWRPLRFVPPILLLMQYGQYYHYLGDGLSLLFALLFSYLYIRMPLRVAALRFVVFLVFSAVVYSVAVVAYLVFVLLCVIFELFNKRHWAVGLLCLLSSVLVPFVANMLFFDMDLSDAYSRMLPFDPVADWGGTILKFGLFLFFPISGFCCAIWLTFSRKHQAGKGGSGWVSKSLDYYRKSRLKWSIDTLALLILATAAFLSTSDRFIRRYLRINYFSSQKMWSQLLYEARQLPVQDYSLFICHDVNRALYHTGRLAYDMFSYPQHPSGLLLPTAKRSEADTLYELGDINRAEDAAYTALALVDYHPASLQRLALINIVKGQPDAARTFLRTLNKDFLYKDWAKQYLVKLEADTLLSNDSEIQHIRSLMFVEDDLRKKIDTTDDFYLNLLHRNNLNRMAFEYLMAWYLLNGQLDKFIENLGRLDDFNYSEIPTHYEQAILFYTAVTGKAVDLHGREISVNTIRRFAEFIRQSQRYEYDIQAAGTAMPKSLKDFDDTYYYYLLAEPGLTE